MYFSNIFRCGVIKMSRKNYKVCCDCGVEKPIELFHRYDKCKKIENNCIECKSERALNRKLGRISSTLKIDLISKNTSNHIMTSINDNLNGIIELLKKTERKEQLETGLENIKQDINIIIESVLYLLRSEIKIESKEKKE